MAEKQGRVQGSTRRAALAMGAVLLAATVALALSASAFAAPGDVYVADEDALPGDSANGAIFRIGAQGGDATPIASGGTFSNPSGMTLDRSGQLLVVDSGSNQLLLVDPSSGTVSPFFSGPPLTNPLDVALGPDGSVYVTDSQADALFRIDPNTRVLSTVASGLPLENPWGLAVSRDGTAYVGDFDVDAVFAVNLATGQVTTFVSSAALLGNPEVLMLTPDERVLIAADSVSNQLSKFDRSTGAANAISTLPDARGLALLRDGSFLVSDVINNTIQKVGPTGTPVTTFSADPDLAWPHDLVVEPARCGGLVPTVEGTDAPEVINGSQFADVISTLGGNDQVNGGGGKDVICGGAGKDKLNGGAGKDRLFGQAGKDTLKGGKGKDKLVGGKGRDRCQGGKGADKGKGCEAGTL